MKTPIAALALSVLLSACIESPVRDCARLAGPGWTHLSAAPADAPELLTRANLPNDASLVWFGQGPDKVLFCDHTRSLVNPGCNASTGYQYEKKDGTWTSRGLLLDNCN